MLYCISGAYGGGEERDPAAVGRSMFAEPRPRPVEESKDVERALCLLRNKLRPGVYCVAICCAAFC